MISKKSKNQHTRSEANNRGFLPDFSRYLFNEFPVDKAYTNHVFIGKLKLLIAELVTAKNPAQDLQNMGVCRKLELLRPSTDKKFISKCNFPEGHLYYAAYGDTPYRIVFGIDSSQRIAYFFALDTTHSIRKG